MIHLIILQKLAELQLQLQRPVTPKDLIGEFKIPRTTLWRYLNDLMEAGMIGKSERGKYYITSGNLMCLLNDCHRDYDRMVWRSYFFSTEGV